MDHIYTACLLYKKLRCSILILLCSTGLYAQQTTIHPSLFGQQYTSCNADYINIINDSMIVSTLFSYGDTAFYRVNKDTLFTTQTCHKSNRLGSSIELYNSFLILKRSSRDTLYFSYYSKRYNDEFTQTNASEVFINNRILEPPVVNFEYLGIEESGPFWGMSKLYFDAEGKGAFTYRPYYIQIHSALDTNLTPRNYMFSLTKGELQTLKECIQHAQIQHKNCMTKFYGPDSGDLTIVLKTKDKKFTYNNTQSTYAQTSLMAFYKKILDRIVHYSKY